MPLNIILLPPPCNTVTYYSRLLKKDKTIIFMTEEKVNCKIINMKKINDLPCPHHCPPDPAISFQAFLFPTSQPNSMSS